MISPQLGFGSLRLKKDANKNIDIALCRNMVDSFLAGGGEYFEVAYAYPHTEEVIGTCLQKHARDSFLLTDKMPVNGSTIKKEEDYYSIFQEQLKRCQTTYFDYYLLHNLGSHVFKKSEELGAFRFLEYIKMNGLARKVGFSFHDSSSVLREILSKYQDLIDVVQLQINYLDWESPVIQSHACYEVAREFDKEVFVMEPIKGGRLINLPKEATDLLQAECPGESPASLALRFPASLDGVRFVLSGMTETDQISDNLAVFRHFCPLSSKEKEVLAGVAEIIHKNQQIECTRCGYCEKVCPKHIPIPDLFHLYENDNKNRVGRMYIRITEERGRGKASDCLRCGRCEQECSQRLPIRKLLADIKDVYEPRKTWKKTAKDVLVHTIGESKTEALKGFYKKMRK